MPKRSPKLSLVPEPTEYQIECACHDFLLAQQYKIRQKWPLFYFTHIQNEGTHKNGKIAGARAKRLGKKAGIADRLIQWGQEDLRYTGQGWVEFKSRKGRLSDEQKDFLAMQEKLGHKTAVCRSLEEFKQILTAWGIL